MAVQALNDVISVQFDGLWHGQRTLSTFFYKVGALVGSPATSAFSAALNTALTGVGNLVPKFLACCPGAYLLNNVWIQTVAPIRVVRDVYALSASGTFGSTSSTANLAMSITRKGDLANRHNVGHIQVPLSNLDPEASNGQISGDMLIVGNALGTQMLQPITVGALGGVIPVLWYPPSAFNSVPLTHVQTQTTIRTMKRRTVGLGI